MIELPDDFRDILVEFADAEVEYVVLGGHALAYYGHPRATKDLDILVRASADNALRVYTALGRFGAPLASFDVREEDFATYGGVLQIGVPPRRIDVLNRASGISYDEAATNRGSFVLDGRDIFVIGRAALIKNKAAAGRPQDLADIAALTQVPP